MRKCECEYEFIDDPGERELCRGAVRPYADAFNRVWNLCEYHYNLVASEDESYLNEEEYDA